MTKNFRKSTAKGLLGQDNFKRFNTRKSTAISQSISHKFNQKHTKNLFNYQNMNNEKFNDEKRNHHQIIDYKAIITRMNSDEAANNEYFPPDESIQKKIDFFFLPYN
jgi:hypothetical protein